MDHVPVFQLDRLQKAYKGRVVLDIPELEISAGTITGLYGPNGSGKSTLLSLLALMTPPTRGRLLYQNVPSASCTRKEKQQISLLTQIPYLLKRSVFDNITYGLKIRKQPHRFRRPKVREQVRSVMAQVGLDFEGFAHRRSDALSGGEAQRVAMAARLILSPRVMLLDEPTASVDVASAGLIRRAALNARQQHNATVVVASHDGEWLHAVCDSVLYVYLGKTVISGKRLMIPGPFIRDEQGRYVQNGSAAPPLYVSTPPDSGAVAVLDEDSWHLFPADPVSAHAGDLHPAPGGGEHRVTATVQSMFYHKKENRIMAAIQIHDLTLTLPLLPEQVIRSGLIPGSRVVLMYRPDQVQWM